jgi:hypothetical protein
MISLAPVRHLFIALLAGALTGCMAPANVVDRKATTAQAVEKAIVIVSASHELASGSNSAASFFLDSGTPHAERVASARTLFDLMVKNDFRGKVGHVYVLELAPGHHRFMSWFMSMRNRSAGSPAGLAPLEFDVAKGEVLYLGNLNMRLRMGETIILHHQIPTAAYAEVQDGSALDIPIAERANPAIAGKVRVALMRQGPWGKADATEQPASAATP